jgi:hypothetical protein
MLLEMAKDCHGTGNAAILAQTARKLRKELEFLCESFDEEEDKDNDEA